MCSIYWARCVNTGTTSRQTRWTSSFDTDRSWLFQFHFDLYCKLAFNNCFSKFNDYTMPIILTSDFTNFQHLSKKIYPDVWAYLSLHCNVNEDRDGPTLTAFKERQVFIMILILLRQSNYCSLTHWCLILSTAMYGWGTCDTLGRVTSFLGTTVSRSYWDRFFASLTSKLVDNIVSLLSRQLCGLMVLDNLQRGQQLRDQRGGKSSKFLIGTTEAAHRVFSYLNFEWDAHKIDMTFTKKQVIPSPHHMCTSEMMDFSSPSLGTDLFPNHCDIPVRKEGWGMVERVRG